MKYDRTVIAYHGCDAAVRDRLLSGEPFIQSSNDFDWLGAGTYFWEYGERRALQFAHDQQQRGKVANPAVVGALIQLGNCFDLMDTRFTDELASAFDMFEATHRGHGTTMPKNAGVDLKLRRLDCAVLNFYLTHLEKSDPAERYDVVRCGFVEGEPAFEGSGIYQQSHVQLAVRNPDCILGVFRPTLES